MVSAGIVHLLLKQSHTIASSSSSSSMELISGLLLIYFQFPAKFQMNILSEVVLIAHTLSEVGAFIQVLCPWGACLINNRNEVVACLAAVA